MQRALAEAVQDQEQQAIEATKDIRKMKHRNLNDKEYLKQDESEDI